MEASSSRRSIAALPRIELMAWGELADDRECTVVCSPAAWAAVADRLTGLRVAARREVTQAVEEEWREYLSGVRGEIIYAVGGGLAVDAAKYLADRSGRGLVCLPTALSADAFFTPAAGVRRDGCVRYVTMRAPDRVCVDLDVIARAPAAVRAAGVCDLLSIATGSWDWRRAEELGLNPPGMAYCEYADRIAAAILETTLECAAAAGRGDRGGLKALLDCLVLEVELCNLLGHSRPEEGSEHYFAYAVEGRMSGTRSHGEVVGPGILIMAAAQGQEIQPLRSALAACGVPLAAIPQQEMRATLRELPQYCARHDLPHGIAHELAEERVWRRAEAALRD